jgi:hypothetical protein
MRVRFSLKVLYFLYYKQDTINYNHTFFSPDSPSKSYTSQSHSHTQRNQKESLELQILPQSPILSSPQLSNRDKRGPRFSPDSPSKSYTFFNK